MNKERSTLLIERNVTKEDVADARSESNVR